MINNINENNDSSNTCLKLYNAIKDFQLNDKEMENKLKSDQMNKSNDEMNNHVYYGDKELKHTDFNELLMGYCSQQISLWKYLTVKETVQFYLNFSGYQATNINKYTKYLLETYGIEKYANKKIGSISGGTKRKLSFIIAICSSPDYVILDEPSAGMDPFTRRFMWKLITKLKKLRKTSVLLTTHSTEEAEAFCDRITILIKGRLICIDSPESIKMNHSDNYVLEVFTNDLKTFEEEYVKKRNIFELTNENEYIVESSYDYHKFTVKMKIENIGNVFSLIEKAKKKMVLSLKITLVNIHLIKFSLTLLIIFKNCINYYYYKIIKKQYIQNKVVNTKKKKYYKKKVINTEKYM